MVASFVTFCILIVPFMEFVRSVSTAIAVPLIVCINYIDMLEGATPSPLPRQVKISELTFISAFKQPLETKTFEIGIDQQNVTSKGIEMLYAICALLTICLNYVKPV